MPKLKTNRSAAKRFKLTGGGRVRRYRAGGSHLQRKKSAARRRRLRQSDLVHPVDEARVRRLLPYL